MTKTDDPTKRSDPANPASQPTVVVELAPAPRVETALKQLASLPGVLLLNSAMKISNSAEQPLGRYSFLVADPFQTIVEPVGTKTPFEHIRNSLSNFSAQTIPDLPPFQGGIAGLFSYDLNRSIESIGAPRNDEFELPAIVAGVYDAVIAWDHDQDRAWIISQGFPETDSSARSERASERAQYFGQLLKTNLAPDKEDRKPDQLREQESKRNACQPNPVNIVDGPKGLQSNFSRQEYIANVEKCVEYIRAGDVFQINLAQRLLFPADCGPIELFLRLCECNPAPFSGYFDLSKISNVDAQIISASPERFFSVRGGTIEVRPIKGTRRRTGQPLVDIQAKEELLASEKDRAENTMIVDLMRNDLSRVCEDDSIVVTQLCELEAYQSVLHLVSAVQGRLKPNHNSIDVLESIFPGGSITGAPKVRAMEIISNLEPSARGAYCGALGYLGFDDNSDFSILIRTITSAGGWWQIPVGGGIVSQSDPVREYEETWTKAAGMLRAVSQPNSTIRNSTSGP